MSRDVSIRVCLGTGGIAAGGNAVLAAFREELAAAELSASLGSRCSTEKVGCRGLCAKDVLVDVVIDGITTTYAFVTSDMVKRIIAEHIIGGAAVAEWTVSEDYHSFLDKQMKVVLADCGIVNPESIASYCNRGGYAAAHKALTTMTPDAVLSVILASGLRGRGGAGFPTAMKWQTCRDTDSPSKYLICNADEGDPGAFMDRAVLEGNPHSVIEGMIIAAYVIGAHEGYVYVRSEYPLAVKRLAHAVHEANQQGVLGKNIFHSKFDFSIAIKLGAGAFVCGEETALIASIEGERGMPRPKPPFPATHGLWGKPTVINNVETLANIPHIIEKGASWFASFGTQTSKGTKVFSLTGKVKNTGLIEVPMGISLRDIIYDIGGGIENGKQLKAVQTGGPSGGCIPASLIDIAVDYESLSKVGSIVGSGGMIVLDEDDCMVNMAKYFLQFTQNESCGKCVPCRVGTKRLLEIIDRITSGNGKEGDIELMVKLSSDIQQTSLCGLGMTAPNPVLSTIRYFRDEYVAHIHNKICPAGVCKALITFSVDPQKCKGCGACLRVCPTGAISGIKKTPHRINRSLCIKCGACLGVCRFLAIRKV